jgi:hypothetical protein
MEKTNMESEDWTAVWLIISASLLSVCGVLFLLIILSIILYA